MDSMEERRRTAQIDVDVHAPHWQGRDDGPGAGHRRWHHAVNAAADLSSRPGDIAVLGFASDEGVRRNGGRVGAAEAPAALRGALGSLALHENQRIHDAGDIAVLDDDLEAGQRRLAAATESLVGAGLRTIVLGGGHETAYGSFTGVHRARRDGRSPVGILNLDAHFDLREAAQRSSGTPFLDIARELGEAGEQFSYAVLGIARSSNTAVLFETADRLGVDYLLDEQCTGWNRAAVAEFVAGFLEPLAAVQLSIDLDVLPASVAPGVSAPAGFGVSFEIINEVCRQVAASGKLALLEVVELNPRLDVDSRTARSAARLIETVARAWT